MGITLGQVFSESLMVGTPLGQLLPESLRRGITLDQPGVRSGITPVQVLLSSQVRHNPWPTLTEFLKSGITLEGQPLSFKGNVLPPLTPCSMQTVGLSAPVPVTVKDIFVSGAS